MKNKKPVYAGLSINRQRVELTVFSQKNLTVERVLTHPMPDGAFDVDGDRIRNPALLKTAIATLLRNAGSHPSQVHLSLPATLLRMVEMPRMEPSGLYVSLSSEAERYKPFDGTEAIVDFAPMTGGQSGSSSSQLQQQVIFGAVRSDTLATYLKVLREVKLKPADISLEPLNELRALAGTGVLDGLIEQIGTDAYWGSIFVEPTRVRLFVWQCNRLIELRETAMETTGFAQAEADSILIEDLLEEIRRTTKTMQPALWLTHHLPPTMRQTLGSRLACPVVPATLGSALAMPPQPAALSTVGAALSSVVAFPFEFDLSRGVAHSGGGGLGYASGADIAGNGEEGQSGRLLTAGVASIGLALLSTGVLALMAMLAAQQIPENTSRRDSIKMEVAGLEARQRELKRKSELDKRLLEAVKNARLRNRVYVALTEDLKRKTPQQLWIQTLKAGNTLELHGKGLNQNAVIRFARSFDDEPYTQAILIDAIKEERLNGSLVYDFTISGGIRLSPELRPDLSSPDETPPTSPTSRSKSGA